MIGATRTFWKVTALTTNPAGQLLVFQHPSAGRQLPAGSVETTESLEDAVRRELHEESGLVVSSQVRLLKVLETALGPTRGIVTEQTRLSSSPELQQEYGLGRATSAQIRRGITVVIEHRTANAVKVRYDELDWTKTPPALLHSISGWVPAAFVTDTVSRALFHVPFAGQERDSWQHAADDHVFTFLWVPLIPRPTLVNGQQEWLDAVYDDLLQARARD